MSRYYIGAAFCFAALSISSSASAIDVTDEMAVSLSVEASCTLTADPLAFGVYDAASDKEAAADLTVSCTNGTPYKVYLESSTSGVRTLTNGAETLDYSLYSDSGRTTAFAENTTDAASATAGASDATVTVYGKVPSGQSVLVGDYTDTVTVTLAY